MRVEDLSVANTPSALVPVTILPGAGILPDSMLRLLVALQPTLGNTQNQPMTDV
jgi:hypothetical protein